MVNFRKNSKQIIILILDDLRSFFKEIELNLKAPIYTDRFDLIRHLNEFAVSHCCYSILRIMFSLKIGG